MPLILALFLPAARAEAPLDEARAALDAAIVQEVRALVPVVAELRGLPMLREVPIQVEEPEELRRQLLADAEDKDEIDAVERAHKTLLAFGLIGPDFPLRDNLTDVLADQVGGYYDPEELRLVLVRRGDAFTSEALAGQGQDRMVAAHELVHALQDQHFDLWALRHRDFTSDDVDLALVSLVEGDASWAMVHLTVGDAGPAALSALDDTTFRDLFLQVDESAFEGALGRMPRILRDSLLLPYLEGMAFAREVHRARGWAGLDEAFRHPPLSTEHVLHPEKYLQGVDPPLRLELPDQSARLGRGWTLVEEDVFGELMIRSLLTQVGGDAADPVAVRDAAAGWGGDAYQVYEHRGGRLTAAWVSAWDTVEDAQDFARTVRRLAPSWRLTREGERVLVAVGMSARAQRRAAPDWLRAPAHPITHLDEVAPRKPGGRGAGAAQDGSR